MSISQDNSLYNFDPWKNSPSIDLLLGIQIGNIDGNTSMCSTKIEATGGDAVGTVNEKTDGEDVII